MNISIHLKANGFKLLLWRDIRSFAWDNFMKNTFQIRLIAIFDNEWISFQIFDFNFIQQKHFYNFFMKVVTKMTKIILKSFCCIFWVDDVKLESKSYNKNTGRHKQHKELCCNNLHNFSLRNIIFLFRFIIALFIIATSFFNLKINWKVE